MNRCEHFSDGKCLALKKIEGWKNHGNDIETHIPKFCAVEEKFIGDETQPKRSIEGRCLADFTAAFQCDDFRDKRVWGMNSY